MAIRPLGKTAALSVGAPAHVAVQTGADVTDVCTFAAFLNTGTTIVSCQASSLSIANAPAAVQPADGTPSASNIILPASMIAPIVFTTPPCPFSLTAIGSAAGPSIIFVTPCHES